MYFSNKPCILIEERWFVSPGENPQIAIIIQLSVSKTWINIIVAKSTSSKGSKGRKKNPGVMKSYLKILREKEASKLSKI
jgi:hypothetical protein